MKNKRMLILVCSLVLLFPVLGGLLMFLGFHHLVRQGTPSNEDAVSMFLAIKNVMVCIASLGFVAIVVSWYRHKKKREQKDDSQPAEKE